MSSCFKISHTACWSLLLHILIGVQPQSRCMSIAYTSILSSQDRKTVQNSL